jgi:hypothetical protein
MIYFKLAIAALLLIGGYWAYNHAYDQGKKEGAAAVQVAWDKDKAAIQADAAKALATAAKDKEDALANNAGAIDDLQTQLSTANTLSAQLALRLRAHTACPAARSSPVPEAGNRSGVVIGAAPPSVGSADEVSGGNLNDSLNDALNECFVNRVKYSALLRELKPQL